MQDSQLQVILKEQHVATENAKQLLVAFGAPFEEAGSILSSYKSVVVTKEDDFATMAEARKMRLALKNIRVDVEKRRKELKEDSLRVGKAIDSVAKYVKETIEPAETYLEEQEKFAELKAAERAAKLKAERTEKLMKYTDDISMYNFDSMDDEKFESLLSTLKAQRDAEVAQAEKVEADRIAAEKAERERQAQIEAENAKLKAEAEAREAELLKEREIEAKKQAKLEEARQAELKVEREKAEAERAKREAIEEAQRKQAEEARKAEELKAEAEAEALLAPDKNKLIEFAHAIELVRTTKLPAVKSNNAQKVVNKIELELSKLYNLIMDEAKGL